MRRVGGLVRAHRTIGGLLLVAVVVAGCGDSKASGAKAKESSDTPETTSTTGGAEGDAKGSGKAKSQGSTTTTVTPGPTGAAKVDAASEQKKVEEDPYTRTLPLSAELATACVKPGGSQTVIIRAAHGAGVAFDTTYSDGLTGMMEGHYGGNMAGYTDPEGTYTNTFVVAPTAPAGEAIVLVLGSHAEDGIGETTATFKVADKVLGSCS